MEAKPAYWLISELPGWNDDWTMNALFSPYESHDHERWQLDFWTRAVSTLAWASDVPLILNLETLTSYFTRKNCNLRALEGIVPELIKKRTLVKVQTVKQKAQSKRDKKGSWKAWIVNKSKNLIKFDDDNRFAIKEKVDGICRAVLEMANERPSLSLDEVLQYLYEGWHLSEEESAFVIDFMYFEMYVEPEGQSNVLKLNHSDLASELDTPVVALSLSLSNIEMEILQSNNQISIIHDNLIAALVATDRLTAKEYLTREKIVQRQITMLRELQTSLEDFIIKVRKCTQRKDVAELLVKMGCPLSNDLGALFRTYQANVDEQFKVQTSVFMPRDEHFDEEELEKELEELAQSV